MKRGANHPTRERILCAATDLMWQHGYRRTSPAQVMRTSGVGQGSFYHHFPDKRSLGLAVVQDLVRRTIAGLDETFAPEVPPLERIRLWIRLSARQYRPPCDRGCPLGKLGLEMASEDPAFREAISPGFAEIRRRIASALLEASAAGQLEAGLDLEGMAELVLSTIEGAILVSQCDGSAGSLDRSIGKLEKLLDRFERPSLVVRGSLADP